MAFTDYDKSSLIVPMNGANGGTTFTDWSVNPKTITAHGDAQTSTSNFKYYDSSGKFNGAGYLTIPNHTDFTLPGDFTLASWVDFSVLNTVVRLYDDEVTGSYGTLFYKSNTNKAVFAFMPDTLDHTVSGNLVSLVGSTSISSSTYVHIAVTCSGLTVRLFLNGILDATGSKPSGAGIYNTGGAKYIGARYTLADYLTGYMQDFFLINGDALWTSDFTPPPRLIGTISGTVKDKDDNVAARTIITVPRCYPTRVFGTVSSGVDGSYSLNVPATECDRIVLADEVDLYNDIVDRIIPE